MNTRSALYIQAIRGPVLLVSIGVLFAIHQAGVLSFARTWPLLVIVIGVMKLLERAWSPVQALPVSYRSPAAYPYAQQPPSPRPPYPQSPGSFRQEPPSVPPRAAGENKS